MSKKIAKPREMVLRRRKSRAKPRRRERKRAVNMDGQDEQDGEENINRIELKDHKEKEH
jgi:hypothetical protein